MTKKQKQELFNAITRIGYKETETKLMQYLEGEVVDISYDFMSIIAWFNLWYNKGHFQSDIESVVSFIQANTYTNPSTNSKSKKNIPITDEFKKQWFDKFGVEVQESISVNVKPKNNEI